MDPTCRRIHFLFFSLYYILFSDHSHRAAPSLSPPLLFKDDKTRPASTTRDQFFPGGQEHSPRLANVRHGRSLFPRVPSKPRQKRSTPSGMLPASRKMKTRPLPSLPWPTRKRGMTKKIGAEGMRRARDLE